MSREDAVELEACLSMDPRAIPGGQRLMESALSDVREIEFTGTSTGLTFIVYSGIRSK